MTNFTQSVCLCLNAGYGNTVPLSDEGKVFCVLYCLVGMPLTMLLMSSSTQRILPSVTHAPVRHLQERWGVSYPQAALLHVTLLLTCTALLFFLLPAAGLCLLERDWSFLESLYFCFISLSTIGLGDYLPGRTRSLAVRRGLEFATSCADARASFLHAHYLYCKFTEKHFPAARAKSRHKF